MSKQNKLNQEEKQMPNPIPSALDIAVDTWAQNSDHPTSDAERQSFRADWLAAMDLAFSEEC